MSTYIYREDSGYDERFDAPGDDAAEHFARELLRDGDWGQQHADKTFTVRASVARIVPEDSEDREDDWIIEDWRTVTVTFQPAEPPCPGRDGHDWQDGTPRGSGGGVIYTDTCAHCGLRRITDTWDTDPATGDVMQTIAYEQPEVAR
jgi:hypothetical protein